MHVCTQWTGTTRFRKRVLEEPVAWESRKNKNSFSRSRESSKSRDAAQRELHERAFKDSQEDNPDRRNRPLSALNSNPSELRETALSPPATIQIKQNHLATKRALIRKSPPLSVPNRLIGNQRGFALKASRRRNGSLGPARE